MPEKICTDCIHSNKCIQAKRHRYVGGCGLHEESGIAKTQKYLEKILSPMQEYSAYCHGADRHEYSKMLRDR